MCYRDVSVGSMHGLKVKDIREYKSESALNGLGQWGKVQTGEGV